MISLNNQIGLVKSLLRTPQTLMVDPRVSMFLLKYFGKFRVKKVGKSYVLHSHLPPLNSAAYTKFVKKHLVEKVSGPSHAQIGITNACPQKCRYCYNKHRSGKAMEKNLIIGAIRELSDMGLAWLGLTGGEPLLNNDIVEIVDRTDKNIAVKLFTTGCTLTAQKARELKNAGLKYVSVSLDSCIEEEHDNLRGYDGAYKTALHAIGLFLDAGIHTGVSAVLTKDMLKNDSIVRFCQFLERLGVHEAWLSEAKPASEHFWDERFVISENETAALVSLQDEYNKKGTMTFNYLGHFEHGGHFGCNAGIKMVYIDAFGEMSPCVFTPITFGNVRDWPVAALYSEMAKNFKPGRKCFVNRNYGLFKKYFRGVSPIPKDDALKIVKESSHNGVAEFTRIQGAGFP
jgi:MoaA/NifB/PqqE/SkfB family radical SAM enzyme